MENSHLSTRDWLRTVMATGAMTDPANRAQVAGVQFTAIVHTILELIRQHLRLQGTGLPPMTTIGIDELMLLVQARLDLKVQRKTIRLILDALVGSDVLGHHPAPERFNFTSYSLRHAGASLNGAVERFLLHHSPPRWAPIPSGCLRAAHWLYRYEILWRQAIGGLPRNPDLIELAIRAKRTGTAWLEACCEALAQRALQGEQP